MKCLSTVLISALLVVLMSGYAIPIEYNTNISPELTVEVGECFYMDVRLDEVPEPLLTAGFFIILDSSLATIVDVAVYDGNDLTPEIWDAGFTREAPDAAGPGTYLIACGNLAGDGVPPDDVRIANVEICNIAEGINTITILTIPDFDTVVSGVFPDNTVYDSEIIPHVITVDQIIPPCRCEISGFSEIAIDYFRDVTAEYDVSSNLLHCENPPVYVWSDDCILADIDQNGLLTVPSHFLWENCHICVTDVANIDTSTGETVDCCMEMT